ncbi:MAG: hypothetical protein JNM22_03320 [Saprospiraceae bacterium]|nr:hypothetical protein [Saprospiraceae bacterium]
MLTEYALLLVQTIQNDINEIERGLEEWLRSQKVRSKKIPAHYVHITLPIQSALSQLTEPDIDAMATGQAIQSILNSAGGFFHLFESLEGGRNAKIPEILFSLKDNLFKTTVQLQIWFKEHYSA